MSWTWIPKRNHRIVIQKKPNSSISTRWQHRTVPTRRTVRTMFRPPRRSPKRTNRRPAMTNQPRSRTLLTMTRFAMPLRKPPLPNRRLTHRKSPLSIRRTTCPGKRIHRLRNLPKIPRPPRPATRTRTVHRSPTRLLHLLSRRREPSRPAVKLVTRMLNLRRASSIERKRNHECRAK